MAKRRPSVLPVIGWREWVGLPRFGVKSIKAKVDTGARTSSLQASKIQEFQRDGEAWVRFSVHPIQRNSKRVVRVEAKILETRAVRSSNGKVSQRPVVVTDVELLGVTWPVELTLAGRDKMGFRMLLGREAVRRRFLVDSGRSFYGDRPPRKKIPQPE